MNRSDVVLLMGILHVCFITVLVGGIYHPDTLAGAVARFFFSLR